MGIKNIVLMILAIILCAAPAIAAEIKTPYFSITLPVEWEQMPMEHSMDTAGNPYIFINRKLNCLVAISAAETGESAKAAADKAKKMMEENKIETGPIVVKDGVYNFSIKRNSANAWFFYGSNGKDLCVVTIWANDRADAKSLFESLKPVDASLFPVIN